MTDLGFSISGIVSPPSHHFSHALHAASFSTTGSSLVIVFDLEGSDGETNSTFVLSDGILSLVHNDSISNDNRGGLGAGYHVATQACGFNPWHESGKLCGMASLKPSIEFIGSLYDLSDGSVKCNVPTDQHKISEFFGSVTSHEQKVSIANFAQKELERAATYYISDKLSRWPTSEIILGGGVATNCKLLTALGYQFPEVTISTGYAPGDTGQCIGNVMWALSGHSLEHNIEVKSPFVGPTFDLGDNKILEGLLEGDYVHRDSCMLEEITNWILRGMPVATVVGYQELGPRALGNRSILFRSDLKELSQRVSHDTKKREWYRPLGVLLGPTDSARLRPSPHMEFCFFPNDVGLRNARFSGCLSNDFSIRYQTLSQFTHPVVARLVHSLEEHDVNLINTSLNFGGKPIVNFSHELIEILAELPELAVLSNIGFFAPKDFT